MYLAIKEMKKEKGRFSLIIGIVILISYLVFFLTGLAYGLAKDNTLAVEMWNADKIVLKAGTNSNLSSSIMDKKVIKDFINYDISPINLSRSVAYINGEKTDNQTINLVLIGLSQNTKDYPIVIEGKKPENKDEVLASISLNKEKNLNIGDYLVLSMNERTFKVVGFTKESKYNVGQVIYTDLYESSPSAISYIEKKELVNEHSKVTKKVPDTIGGILIHGKSDLSSNDNYDVISIDDFIMKLPGYFAQVLTFGLMISFLILISTIVLGVFMYIITIQKKQTFGIMKVQGISNSYISKSVIMQSLIVSTVGVIVGLALTIGSEMILPVKVPFRSNYFFYAVISVLIIIISLMGAIFSVRGVSKVDPLEVLN